MNAIADETTVRTIDRRAAPDAWKPSARGTTIQVPSIQAASLKRLLDGRQREVIDAEDLVALRAADAECKKLASLVLANCENVVKKRLKTSRITYVGTGSLPDLETDLRAQLDSSKAIRRAAKERLRHVYAELAPRLEKIVARILEIVRGERTSALESERELHARYGVPFVETELSRALRDCEARLENQLALGFGMGGLVSVAAVLESYGLRLQEDPAQSDVAPDTRAKKPRTAKPEE